MSYTNTTEHYGLPQYIGTDKPTMLGDFNTAMEIIDSTMYKNQQAANDNVANVSGVQTELNTLSQSVEQANTNVSQLEQQSVTLENNLTTTTQNANTALTNSQSAQQTATTANNTANSAQTTANQANTTSLANAGSIEELESRVSALEGNKLPESPLSLYVSGSHQLSPTTTTYSSTVDNPGWPVGTQLRCGMLSVTGSGGGGDSTGVNVTLTASATVSSEEKITYTVRFTRGSGATNVSATFNGLIIIENI